MSKDQNLQNLAELLTKALNDIDGLELATNEYKIDEVRKYLAGHLNLYITKQKNQEKELERYFQVVLGIKMALCDYQQVSDGLTTLVDRVRTIIEKIVYYEKQKSERDDYRLKYFNFMEKLEDIMAERNFDELLMPKVFDKIINLYFDIKKDMSELRTAETCNNCVYHEYEQDRCEHLSCPVEKNQICNNYKSTRSN